MPKTSAIEARGSRAATGLRNKTSSRTRIRAIVAMPTVFSAVSWASRSSSLIAASPVNPTSRSLPANASALRSRTASAASITRSSPDVPSKLTWPSWILPSGETDSALPVCAPRTPSMPAPSRSWTTASMSRWSAALSRPPSSRAKTRRAVAPDCSGNAVRPSSSACADSYELGRKLASSELVTSPSRGANGMITTAAMTQARIVARRCRVTKRARRSNIGTSEGLVDASIDTCMHIRQDKRPPTCLACVAGAVAEADLARRHLGLFLRGLRG